jgi:hypothetical protein
MYLWSYLLNHTDQANEFRFGPEYRSTTKSLCFAAAFHPREALIVSATKSYVELYRFNPENGLSFNNDVTLTPLPIIMSPLQHHQLPYVDAGVLTFTVGFHPSLDYCFTSYDNELYIYNTSEVSKKAYNLRTMEDKGPNAAILYGDMGARPSGITRTSSAPPGAGNIGPWEHLTDNRPTVGPNIGIFPPTGKKNMKLTLVGRTGLGTTGVGTTGVGTPDVGTPGVGTPDVTRPKTAGKGRRKTSRYVKKIVRKTKKYRKHRITYRTRK